MRLGAQPWTSKHPLLILVVLFMSVIPARWWCNASYPRPSISYSCAPSAICAWRLFHLTAIHSHCSTLRFAQWPPSLLLDATDIFLWGTTKSRSDMHLLALHTLDLNFFDLYSFYPSLWHYSACLFSLIFLLVTGASCSSLLSSNVSLGTLRCCMSTFN